MGNFVVPQFIDVEDKILGPITVRQFVIMLVGVLLLAIFYKIFGMTIYFVLIALMILGAIFLLGFFKVNGRPFYYFVLNIFKIYKTPRLRVWRREVTDDDLSILRSQLKEDKEVKEDKIEKRVLDYKTLSELSLVVNTGGVYRISKQQKNDET